MAAVGCTIEDADQESVDPVVQDLQDQAEAIESGSPEEDVPYDGCQFYGDCVYCEHTIWRYGDPCAEICYGYSCYGGSWGGGGCYDDCGLRA